MMRRGARGAESSGVLLARLINARAAVESVRDALEGARAAGSDSVCRRLRLARASLGGVVRHLEGLHVRACEREWKARQAGARCVRCGGENDVQPYNGAPACKWCRANMARAEVVRDTLSAIAAVDRDRARGK